MKLAHDVTCRTCGILMGHSNVPVPQPLCLACFEVEEAAKPSAPAGDWRCPECPGSGDIRQQGNAGMGAITFVCNACGFPITWAWTDETVPPPTVEWRLTKFIRKHKLQRRGRKP